MRLQPIKWVSGIRAVFTAAAAKSGDSSQALPFMGIVMALPGRRPGAQAPVACPVSCTKSAFFHLGLSQHMYAPLEPRFPTGGRAVRPSILMKSSSIILKQRVYHRFVGFRLYAPKVQVLLRGTLKSIESVRSASTRQRWGCKVRSTPIN